MLSHIHPAFTCLSKSVSSIVFALPYQLAFVPFLLVLVGFAVGCVFLVYNICSVAFVVLVVFFVFRMFQIVLPYSVEIVSVGFGILSVAFSFTVFPCAVVNVSVLVVKLSITIVCAVFEVSFVHASVRIF